LTGRQGRRHKQQFYEVNKKRRHWKLKEETLDCTVWRNCFGRGYGTDARHAVDSSLCTCKIQPYSHRVNAEMEFHLSHACVVRAS